MTEKTWLCRRGGVYLSTHHDALVKRGGKGDIPEQRDFGFVVVKAMGCRTYAGDIVRATARGRKKRFAPVLALWHHPYYPLGV